MITGAENKLRHVLDVGGMTCGSCARAVERALSRVADVEQAQVDAATGRAVVTGAAAAEELISAVEGAGYTARIAIGAANEGGDDERRGSGCCR